MTNDELKHYGILGMKWGVRRYQNYDGSYTQAGMKRYNKSMENYESSRSKEKQIKADYKAGKATKLDVAKAKGERKAYESQVKADYKQLKLDKLGDKGKLLYAEGRRVRYMNQYKDAREMALAGGVVCSGLMATYGLYKVAGGTLLATGGLAIAHGVLSLKEMNDRKLLGAYYAHSRNPKALDSKGGIPDVVWKNGGLAPGPSKPKAANAEWAAQTRKELIKGSAEDTVKTMLKRRRR